MPTHVARHPPLVVLLYASILLPRSSDFQVLLVRSLATGSLDLLSPVSDFQVSIATLSLVTRELVGELIHSLETRSRFAYLAKLSPFFIQCLYECRVVRSPYGPLFAGAPSDGSLSQVISPEYVAAITIPSFFSP